MFPRYLLATCLLALVVIVNAAELDSASIDDDLIQVEPRNPALAFAIRFIAKELGKRVARCAFDAAQACRSDWDHAHALVKCAKEFAKNNKGRCLV